MGIQKEKLGKERHQMTSGFAPQDNNNSNKKFADKQDTESQVQEQLATPTSNTIQRKREEVPNFKAVCIHI